MKVVLAVLAVAAGLSVASPALAHSFDTVFVLPISGRQAEAGNQARDGFMFVAREREDHPDETADGHLGGLDVYLRLVDSKADENDVVTRVGDLTQRAADDTPWIVAPAALLATIQRQVGGAETIVLDLSTPLQADVRTMDGRPFKAAFEAAFGYAPTLAVFAGYAAARQIDTAVRAEN
jgi:hypothetical protein